MLLTSGADAWWAGRDVCAAGSARAWVNYVIWTFLLLGHRVHAVPGLGRVGDELGEALLIK